MRSLLICAAALLVLPAAARAQGGAVGMSAQVLAREEVQVAAGAGMERAAGGALRLSVPLLLTHAVRPLVLLQQRRGDPRCELVSGGARAEEGWSARLRCTTESGWARLVIIPKA
jgi:hypothetical protein